MVSLTLFMIKYCIALHETRESQREALPRAGAGSPQQWGFLTPYILHLYPKPAVRDGGCWMTRFRPNTQMLIKYLATGVCCVRH